MSRIDAMQTTPVGNLTHDDKAAWERYAAWMVHAYRHRTSGVVAAKRVLGRQDFCWTGNYRCYIWERPFEVGSGEQAETWHWRLFASKRGLVLEIEDKYRCPDGESIKKAGAVGLDHFIKTWEATDGL